MDDENLFESLSRNAKFGMSKLRYVKEGKRKEKNKEKTKEKRTALSSWMNLSA